MEPSCTHTTYLCFTAGSWDLGFATGPSLIRLGPKNYMGPDTL